MASADLLDVQLVEASVAVALDRLKLKLDVGAARDLLGHRVLADQLAGLFEVRGRGQDLRELAREARVGPQAVRLGARGLLVFAPADLHATRDDGLLRRLRSVELDILPVGRRRTESVADPRGQLDRLGPEAGDQDRHGLFGQVVDARVLHAVVAPAVAAHAALP